MEKIVKAVNDTWDDNGEYNWHNDGGGERRKGRRGGVGWGAEKE